MSGFVGCGATLCTAPTEGWSGGMFTSAFVVGAGPWGNHFRQGKDVSTAMVELSTTELCCVGMRTSEASGERLWFAKPGGGVSVGGPEGEFCPCARRRPNRKTATILQYRIGKEESWRALQRIRT